MEKYNKLTVLAGEEPVGTLALYRNSLCAFEYSDDWLRNGFPLNPLSLPLRKEVFIPKYDPFDGLFGVFSDSLPDGFGRLLVDRMLLKQGENPAAIGPLNRLAIVGNSGSGLLSYRPELPVGAGVTATADYDRYAEECRKILNSRYSQDLDELFALGSSSGGARPKIFTEIEGEPWIIKFPSSIDPEDIGEQEYRYCLCAMHCGIEVPEVRLFPSCRCSGYFGVKRFDRRREQGTPHRVHTVTVSGLLEVSHRIPALDYNSLMALTLHLTRSFDEVEKMFRLMCFNVFAHNRDDHSKNFSFLYDDAWHLAPAYDLTYSNSLGGEHATCVNGEGAAPGLPHLLAVADKIGLPHEESRDTAERIRETVQQELGKYIRKT